MKCLVLASGFGTRLYPLTVHRAKALLEYKGRPVLTHIVDRVPAGVEVFVCCNRRFEADFREWQKQVGRQVELCVEDVWSEEQKKGAVGSLNFWVKEKGFADDLLVVAGDNYFEFDLSKFITAYDGRNVLVAVYDIGERKKAKQFGVVRLEGTRIVEFEEKPAEPKSSLVATAIYVLPPRIFPVLSYYHSLGERDNLGSFVAYLVERDEVRAYTFSELWLDIGSIFTPKTSG
jgi:glucose-1-phosphate thymidylyltransferase